jgi:hypothetical protein
MACSRLFMSRLPSKISFQPTPPKWDKRGWLILRLFFPAPQKAERGGSASMLVVWYKRSINEGSRFDLHRVSCWSFVTSAVVQRLTITFVPLGTAGKTRNESGRNLRCFSTLNQSRNVTWCSLATIAHGEPTEYVFRAPPQSQLFPNKEQLLLFIHQGDLPTPLVCVPRFVKICNRSQAYNLCQSWRFDCNSSVSF